MKKIATILVLLAANTIFGFAQIKPCQKHADNNAYFLRGLDKPVLYSEFWLSNLSFYYDVRKDGVPIFSKKLFPFDRLNITEQENQSCREFIKAAFIVAKLEIVRRHPSFSKTILMMEPPSIGFVRGLFYPVGHPPAITHTIAGMYCPSCTPEIRVGIFDSDEYTLQTAIHEHLHYLIEFLPLGEVKSKKEHEWVDKNW